MIFVCLGCKTHLSIKSSTILCDFCFRQLTWAKNPNNIRTFSRQKLTPLAAFLLNSTTYNLVSRWKYRPGLKTSALIRSTFKSSLKLQLAEETFDFVTFVPNKKPSLKSSSLTRLHNALATEDLARWASIALGIPTYSLLSIEPQNKKQNKNLDRRSRLTSNLSFGVVAPSQKIPLKIKGSKILIIDDIWTTGVTLTQAIDQLELFKPGKVVPFVLGVKLSKSKIML